MTKFNMKKYMKQVEEEETNHPEWRYGQVLFNVLYEMKPKIANEIRGTNSDPFYFTKGPKTYRFIKWLEELE